MVICLERGADLHMAQVMPLPLTFSCINKIQIGFTFLVPAHPGSPEQRAVKLVCVCVCVVYSPVVEIVVKRGQCTRIFWSMLSTPLSGSRNETYNDVFSCVVAEIKF